MTKVHIKRRYNSRSLVWEYIKKSLLLCVTLGLYFPYFAIWVVDIIVDQFEIEIETEE